MGHALWEGTLWRKLTLRDDGMVYGKDPEPACDGATMLEMCERGWFKVVRKDPFVFEITGPGIVKERSLYGGKASR